MRDRIDNMMPSVETATASKLRVLPVDALCVAASTPRLPQLNALFHACLAEAALEHLQEQNTAAGRGHQQRRQQRGSWMSAHGCMQCRMLTHFSQHQGRFVLKLLFVCAATSAASPVQTITIPYHKTTQPHSPTCLR